MHKTTKFNHGVWVKSCTDINTELRKKGKYNSEKEFFNLRNDAFFGETVILTERYWACNKPSKKKLFGTRTKLSYKFFFSENVLAIEMKKNAYIHE